MRNPKGTPKDEDRWPAAHDSQPCLSSPALLLSQKCFFSSLINPISPIILVSLAQFFAPGHKSLEISGYALWIQVLLCDRGGSMLRSSVLKMLPSSFCRRQSSRVRQQLGLSYYKHEASGQLPPVVPCDLSWTLGMGGGHNSSMPRTRPALTRRPRMEELGFIPSLSTFKYCVPACLSPVATIHLS